MAAQDKQVKILVVICIGGLVAWYFTKSPAMDVDASKAVNAKAAEQMRAMNEAAAHPANQPGAGAVPPPPAQPAVTTVANPVAAFDGSKMPASALAAPPPPPSVPQPKAVAPVTVTSSAVANQQRQVASLPPAATAAHSTDCNLDELKQNRNAHDDISDEEWACALTKAHDTVHVVERGETMSEISEYEFGTDEYWPKIWSLNPEIENPYELHVGQKLRLTKN